MASDKASVSFNCEQCGTKLTWPDDTDDSSEITCANCGKHFGTYGNAEKAWAGAGIR
jgi:DNA-directed RNA polymerase subunit RPC12/RpoP